MRSPEAVPGAGWQRHGLGREESGRAHFQLQVAAGEALQSLALAPCGARVPQCPHLGSDQGLKAGLEVVEPAVVEPRHLIQELLVLGLEVVPHRPQLFSGLESKTSGSGLLVVDLASTLGARCVCWGWVGGWGALEHLCLAPTAPELVPRWRRPGCRVPQGPLSLSTAPFSWYLVEFGQHGPRLLLLLVLLHLGLQPPVVLQGLLPPLHGHVEAWEDTAEPVGHRPFCELWPSSLRCCQAHSPCAS